jgi:hypothetical protein
MVLAAPRPTAQSSNRFARSREEPRPVLRGVKDADNNNRFLKWLVKDQAVAVLRHDKPADGRVAGYCSQNSPAKGGVQRQEVGGVENRE